jgi:serine/threonine protein kinase
MHRAIKPDNILASPYPTRAVIIDFGCASWETSSKDHMKGTVRYLAPEIIVLKENNTAPNTTFDLSTYELLRGSRAKFQNISWKFYDGQSIFPALGGNDVNWAFVLIKEMLRSDPKSRIKSGQARQKCSTVKAEGEQRQLQPRKREHRSEC